LLAISQGMLKLVEGARGMFMFVGVPELGWLCICFFWEPAILPTKWSYCTTEFRPFIVYISYKRTSLLF